MEEDAFSEEGVLCHIGSLAYDSLRAFFDKNPPDQISEEPLQQPVEARVDPQLWSRTLNACTGCLQRMRNVLGIKSEWICAHVQTQIKTLPR